MSVIRLHRPIASTPLLVPVCGLGRLLWSRGPPPPPPIRNNPPCRLPDLGKHSQGFQHRGSTLPFEILRTEGVLTADDPTAADLLGFVADRGHREFRCLSREHNPASCVPCLDFSPWLRERVLRHDVD